MRGEPYRESEVSEEETTPAVARPAGPEPVWKIALGVVPPVAYLLLLLVDGIYGSPTRLVDLVLVIAALVSTPFLSSDSIRLAGASLRLTRSERRFQEQCEREAVRARRARWKARVLAEREAARGAAKKTPSGASADEGGQVGEGREQGVGG